MIKSFRIALGAALLCSPFISSGAYAQCSIDDFLIGSPGISANACITGRNQISDIRSEVETWVDSDLSIIGLNVDYSSMDPGFDLAGTTDYGSHIYVNDMDDGGFRWHITDPSDLNGIEDAIFVIQEGGYNNQNDENGYINWAAYLVQNIAETFGTFFTEDTFNSSDYDVLAVFGTEGPNSNFPAYSSVPEIDAASSGIIFSLLLSLVALVRERRGSTISRKLRNK